MRPLRYVPYDEMRGAPNIVVDGSATEGTVLCLSHWPNMPAPPGLERDLSAEMALAYLDRADLHGVADIVSNNHFDQDGLMSVYALVAPDAARARAAFVADVAAAGDFATYRDRDAARVSMVIAAFADPARSPVEVASGDDRVAALYEAVLGRLPELLEHPDRYRDVWADEDATLDASERLVASGAVRIEDDAELDLATVFVPADAPDAGGHRFGGGRWARGLHPMAINNAVERFAVLTMRGQQFELSYRYESWVQYRSATPRPRVDLSPLAAALTAEEPGDARWVFEGVGELSPRLYLHGAAESVLEPADFRSRLEAFLRDAPPAWDPYSRVRT
jgi:hypothetical protein